MMTKEQIELAKNALRLDQEMKQAGYKAVIASVAEEIWQRPMRKAQAEQLEHLKGIGFSPEVIVETPSPKHQTPEKLQTSI